MKFVFIVSLAAALFTPEFAKATEIVFNGAREASVYIIEDAETVALKPGHVVPAKAVRRALDRGMSPDQFKTSSGTPLVQTDWYKQLQLSKEGFADQKRGGVWTKPRGVGAVLAPVAIAAAAAGFSPDTVAASATRINAAKPEPARLEGSNVGLDSELDTIVGESNATPAPKRSKIAR